MLVDPGLVLGVVGVIGVPAAIGLTMAATTHREFLFVRGCFALATALTIFSVVWLTHEMPLGLLKLSVVGIVGAAATVGLALAWDWVSHKEAAVLQPKLPDVTLRFVYPDEPALMLVNQSEVVAKQIKWTVLLWNLDQPKSYSSGPHAVDSHEPLQIPISIFDFMRGGANAIQNVLNTPLVTPHIKKGDKLFGCASVVCPECQRGHTFVVSFTLGQGGWYAELSDQTNGDVLIPRRLTRETVNVYMAEMLARAPEAARIPIREPF